MSLHQTLNEKFRQLGQQKQAKIADLNLEATCGSSFFSAEVEKLRETGDQELAQDLHASNLAVESLTDEICKEIHLENPLKSPPFNPIPPSTPLPMLNVPPPGVDNALTVSPSKRIRPTPPRLRLPPQVDEIYNAMLEALGTEQDIKEALLTDGSEESINFLRLLVDPNKKALSITRKAEMSKLTLGKLRKLTAVYQLQKAQGTILARLPQFAHHVHDDAATKAVECGRCDGVGYIEDKTLIEGTDPKEYLVQKRLCPRCDGHGKEDKAGDRHARQMIAQTVGWVKKESAAIVNVNVGGVESVIRDIEQRQKDTIEVKPND